MAVERRKERDPEHSQGHRSSEWGSSGEAEEFFEQFGIDTENMSPKAQAVTGLVIGGVILLAAAVLVFATDLWWLIFVFGWALFPALGLFARGVAGLVDSGAGPQPRDGQERELLGALKEHGELTPAQAAMETSMTVAEADGMLRELADNAHIQVRVRGGGIFYALWEHDKVGELKDR